LPFCKSRPPLGLPLLFVFKVVLLEVIRVTVMMVGVDSTSMLMSDGPRNLPDL
jgi:hypothetical protein